MPTATPAEAAAGQLGLELAYADTDEALLVP